MTGDAACRDEEKILLLPDSSQEGHGTINAAKTVSPRSKPRHATTSAVRTEDWMAALRDEFLMSALTIPGTHDSAAFTYRWPFIATQRMDFLQQLNAGIRYFDLRCSIRDDIVEMVHGTAYLNLRLDVVLDTMYVWLEAHPQEALIVQIKRDRSEENSSLSFSQAIVQTIEPHSARWRTANTTPCLGELRGKIQLFRRFTGRGLYAYGIDVSRWQDNPTTPFTIYTWHGIRITIQDHYSFPDPEPLPDLITKKGGDVRELLNRAATDIDTAHWYINFSSSFEFNIYYQVPPREVAAGGWWAFRWVEGINIRLRGFLRDHKGKKRYGVIAMDFPEVSVDDLVAAIVKTNFEPQNSLWEAIGFFLPAVLFLLLLSAGILLRILRST